MEPVDIVFAVLLAAWCATWSFVIWADRRARKEVAEIAAMARARQAELG